MTEPTIADILDAYKAGHIVERRWRNGSTDQCKIDAAGQAWWDDGSGAWRRANFIPVHAPENGTIRIIKQRTEANVRNAPIVGDVVASNAFTYTVVYADDRHVLTEFELDGCVRGEYWSRHSWARLGDLWLSITPAQEATE